jgi:peptide/nickel transport system ATP-binding protein
MEENVSRESAMLLEVEDLAVRFPTNEGMLQAVDGVAFSLGRGSTLGVVGESGCGKSVTSQAIMGIVPRPGSVSGSVRLHRRDGERETVVDLAALPPDGERMRSIRGKDVTMIFQEPMTSFSAHYTMGNQLMEAILLHRTRDRREARGIAIEMLRKVGIANPEKRIDEYPHEFSGGMRQRVMIAMALSCNPELLIADEPTTALDVTIQAQVLELMKGLQREYGMSILYITHDLGVIAEMCAEVAVMYLGKVVEMAGVEDIFYDPRHPYTSGLLASVPRIGSRRGGRLQSIEGVVPVPLNLPPRCGFFDRCPRMIGGLCDTRAVPMAEVTPGHRVRCFLYPEVRAALAAEEVRQ